MNEDFVKQLKVEEEIKTQLNSSFAYVDWLVDYIKDKDYISTDLFLLYPDKETEENKKQLQGLPLLFEQIENYATKNYINAKSREFGAEYSFEHKKQCFNIGFMSGQGTFFYCEKGRLEEDTIHYKNVMTGVMTERAAGIDVCVSEIMKKVKRAYKTGADRNSILRAVNIAIDEVEVKQSKGKALKKCK